MKEVCYVSIFSHAKIGKRELVQVYFMNAYTFYFSFSVIRSKNNELMKVTKTCVGCMGFIYLTTVTPPHPWNNTCQIYVTASFILEQH